MRRGLCDHESLETNVLDGMPFFVCFLRLLYRKASTPDLLERLWTDPHFSDPVRQSANENEEWLPLFVFHQFQKELEQAKILGGILKRRYLRMQRNRAQEEGKTPIPFTVPVTGRLAELLQYAASEERVCPSPSSWDRIYKMLPQGWSITGAPISPPLPLILGGWIASPFEKRARLAHHIRWAAEYGVLERVDTFLRGLPDQEWYKG